MSGTKFVLVVEDDDEIRNIIVSSLKAESQDLGLVIIEAKDGREAIQYAGRQEFNCVVTDLNMPRTSGQELIKSLLGDAMNANTPTVVVSAAIDQDFLAAFRGVRTLSKPFDPVALSQIVMREIKLGRLDERVPVHLLNPLAESMRSILIDDMNLLESAISILPPVVRRAGEKPDGDMLATVTLTTGMMQAKITIGFDRNFLLQMKTFYFAPRRTQWAAMNLEVVARHSAQALLDKADHALSSIFGVQPRVAEISIFDLLEAGKMAESSKLAGVSIALGTDQGRVFISAMAPTKPKRGFA